MVLQLNPAVFPLLIFCAAVSKRTTELSSEAKCVDTILYRGNSKVACVFAFIKSK